MNPELIFDISCPLDFEKKALEIFKFQFENNLVYRSFCDLLCKHPSEIKELKDIPFLPIDFFKSHEIKISSKKTIKIFTSSGTTGSNLSKHYVTDLDLYEKSFMNCFKVFYGDINDYTILGLLPSYLEKNNSSLVYMVNKMIEQSKFPESRFYLDEIDELKETILNLEKEKRKTILIGVSYALLDLIEYHKFNLNHTIIMETGGMKGKRKELIKSELHKLLKNGFGVNNIHSEYGMTELLSQAYSKKNGLFSTPPWMKILIRDTEDPQSILPLTKTGGINIIDLANINSCPFIATMDLGKLHVDGQFEILGRFDQSDIRGCNLMVT
jgi:phenylacetate-coenzyme A ligase PaaK-like adenylate-forming protein